MYDIEEISFCPFLRFQSPSRYVTSVFFPVGNSRPVSSTTHHHSLTSIQINSQKITSCLDRLCPFQGNYLRSCRKLSDFPLFFIGLPWLFLQRITPSKRRVYNVPEQPPLVSSTFCFPFHRRQSVRPSSRLSSRLLYLVQLCVLSFSDRPITSDHTQIRSNPFRHFVFIDHSSTMPSNQLPSISGRPSKIIVIIIIRPATASRVRVTLRKLLNGIPCSLII